MQEYNYQYQQLILKISDQKGLKLAHCLDIGDMASPSTVVNLLKSSLRSKAFRQVYAFTDISVKYPIRGINQIFSGIHFDINNDILMPKICLKI